MTWQPPRAKSGRPPDKIDPQLLVERKLLQERLANKYAASRSTELEAAGLLASLSAGEPPRIKLEQAREAEEQSCSGSGEVTGENSRRRPRTAALQHDDGPLSAEDARARAHKQQRHESVEEARRGKAVEDVLSGSGCESMYTVNGEAEKPVLVKADSASEAEEALGAAAALMELFSRGLVDDPKKPAAKSGASHRRDPNGKQNKYCHFCQQIKVVFSPPPLPVGDADGKHNKYCHFCHNIIKVVYSPPPTLAPAAAPLPLVLPLICLVRRARARGGGCGHDGNGGDAQVEKAPSLGPTSGEGSAGTAFSGGQASSFASSAASNFAAGSSELKGPGGGGKMRKANWTVSQRAILNEEYNANRNPSRETVERVVARLHYTMDYKQASDVLCEEW